MLKALFVSSLTFAMSFSTFAEIQISEKIRLPVQSLVNPDIERLAIPSTPNNMTLPEFGKGVIGWGAGPQDAETRFLNVTKADVELMKSKSVTLEMAKAWQIFYENETKRNAGNPTAPLRAQLMKKIVSLW